MTLDEYKQQVSVVIVPEEEVPHPSGDKGKLAGESTFWCYTEGLAKFARYELELRDVPAMFVPAAGGELNHWGHYSATHQEGLQPGETVMAPGALPLILRLRLSPDLFFQDRRIRCLRLHPDAVLFRCGFGDSGANPCRHPLPSGEAKAN